MVNIAKSKKNKKKKTCNNWFIIFCSHQRKYKIFIMCIMCYTTYIIHYFSEDDKLPSAVNIYINNWYNSSIENDSLFLGCDQRS